MSLSEKNQANIAKYATEEKLGRTLAKLKQAFPDLDISFNLQDFDWVAFAEVTETRDKSRDKVGETLMTLINLIQNTLRGAKFKEGKPARDTLLGYWMGELRVVIDDTDLSLMTGGVSKDACFLLRVPRKSFGGMAFINRLDCAELLAKLEAGEDPTEAGPPAAVAAKPAAAPAAAAAKKPAAAAKKAPAAGNEDAAAKLAARKADAEGKQAARKAEAEAKKAQREADMLAKRKAQDEARAARKAADEAKKAQREADMLAKREEQAKARAAKEAERLARLAERDAKNERDRIEREERWAREAEEKEQARAVQENKNTVLRFTKVYLDLFKGQIDEKRWMRIVHQGGLATFQKQTDEIAALAEQGYEGAPEALEAARALIARVEAERPEKVMTAEEEREERLKRIELSYAACTVSADGTPTTKGRLGCVDGLVWEWDKNPETGAWTLTCVEGEYKRMAVYLHKTHISAGLSQWRDFAQCRHPGVYLSYWMPKGYLSWGVELPCTGGGTSATAVRGYDTIADVDLDKRLEFREGVLPDIVLVWVATFVPFLECDKLRDAMRSAVEREQDTLYKLRYKTTSVDTKVARAMSIAAPAWASKIYPC